jgi:hypothetical protein
MLIDVLSHFASLAIVTPFALIAFDVLSTEARKEKASKGRLGEHEQKEAHSV